MKAYLQLIDTHTPGPRCDVTPLFADPAAFAQLVGDLTEPFASTLIDYVAGIDALGFILGTAMALRLAARPATERKTYGFHRFEILSALVNGVSLVNAFHGSAPPTTAPQGWSVNESIMRSCVTGDRISFRGGHTAGISILMVGAEAEVFRTADKTLPEGAVLASNTSSIPITRLASVTDRSDRVIGMHFFNPVPVMALVELIRGLQTSDETHARALAFAKGIGKTPITVKNGPGFAVNRILCPMINEAIFALQEGMATAEDIDTGMKLGCNHPIGPLALADMVGLDTLLAVMQVFYEGFNDPKYRPAPLLKEMVAAGRLGRKSNRGFYVYG